VQKGKDEGEGKTDRGGKRQRMSYSPLAAAVYSCGSISEKKKGSGARDLLDDGAHDEGEQGELREVSTSDEMLHASAMSWRRRTSRRRCVREGGESVRRAQVQKKGEVGARPWLLREEEVVGVATGAN
jgi:hypothetical protein